MGGENASSEADERNDGEPLRGPPFALDVKAFGGVLPSELASFIDHQW